MAYTKSGWYTNSLAAPLTAVAQTGGSWSLTTAASMGISLLLYASVTDGSSPVQFQTTSQAWVNTFEATGTGWATGGPLLSVAAAGGSVTPQVNLTGSSPYALTYTWASNLSVTGTTLTGVGGCILYLTILSAPISKPMVLSLCFGAAYSTVAGTFGITPSGTGLSVLTLTQ